MLYQGNCLDVMPAVIPDNSIDLVFTDVPYSLGYSFENDKLSLEEQRLFIEKYVKEFHRVLIDGGTAAIFCSQELLHYMYFVCMKNGFSWQNEIIWYREGGQPPKKKLAIHHEVILVITKGNLHKIFNLDDIRVRSIYADTDKRLNPLGKNPGDVWYVPALFGKKLERIVGSNGKAVHPTQKPKDICIPIIKAYSNEGDIILDAFMGTGTIPYVAKTLNRGFIGIEIDPIYFNFAKNRIEGN